MIRKNRPAWQQGHLNGVGGKIEKGETALDAMIREFWEETGVKTSDWVPFCTLQDELHSFEVVYYRATGDTSKCRTTTDEKIEVVNTKDLPSLKVIPNLQWIVPMALDPRLASGTVIWSESN